MPVLMFEFRKRIGLPWEGSDLKKLRKFAEAGMSSSFAARQLGRSNGATRYKAMLEGIRFQSLGKRHSQLQKARHRSNGRRK